MTPSGGTPLPDPRHKQAWARRKAAARTYQPKRIRLLIVDEAPPAEDAAYFYFEDGAADVVFREVCSVLFESAPGASKPPYLKELRRRGVFVVELKPDAPRGDETLGPYVAPLLLNLDALAPAQIVLIGADVRAAAFREMTRAGLPVVDVPVPYPAAGHDVEFRQKFRQALVRAGLEKLIRPLPESATPT